MTFYFFIFSKSNLTTKFHNPYLERTREELIKSTEDNLVDKKKVEQEMQGNYFADVSKQ